MIEVIPHGDGCMLRVRAQPRARRSRIVGAHGGALKVAVTEPPEQGRANEAIAELLAEALDIPRSRVALVAGDTARDKRFFLGISAADLTARLKQWEPDKK